MPSARRLLRRRYRSGKTPSSQSVQIRFEVYAPEEVVRRLTPDFFHDVIDHVLMGEEVPGVKITAIIWERDRKVYTYEDEDDIPEVLEKVVSIFGRDIDFEVGA
jgi:hypothetical protein